MPRRKVMTARGPDRRLNADGDQGARRAKRQHLLRRAEAAGMNEMAEIASGHDCDHGCAKLWKDELLPAGTAGARQCEA
ncbi:hypothetical protein [Bradyrhizobium sp. SEMIA]|uniref:hypothetical protein n=1 Tax=Bradyrhizobium sp. SEMIA TaxID=2597515 RepID=UPI00223F25CF|nr:hypothetical protein [Bradyrhizobium sp. SEMIA]